MSNWIDYRLDVLAGSLEEINRIASRLKQPSSKLADCVTPHDSGPLWLATPSFVKLIAATRTQAGLKVKAKLDPNSYPGGIKVSKANLENVQLRPDKFHGGWNYTILPHPLA